MPRYAYVCEMCGQAAEAQRSMAAADAAPQCVMCGATMRRDYAAERPAMQSYPAYESAAAGVPECVMRRAFRVGQDWFVRDRRAPRGRRRINPAGFGMNPQTGNVLVANRGEKRRLLRERGLTDYGDAT